MGGGGRLPTLDQGWVHTSANSNHDISLAQAECAKLKRTPPDYPTAALFSLTRAASRVQRLPYDLSAPATRLRSRSNLIPCGGVRRRAPFSSMTYSIGHEAFRDSLTLG